MALTDALGLTRSMGRSPARGPFTKGISASRVSKQYDGHWIVSDVDIAIRRGEIVGLLGPNGAGKSTLFSIFAGIIVPDAGEVFFEGRNITSIPLYARARLGIGYLPQQSSIFRGLTVEQNIELVLEMHEPDRGLRRKQLNALISELDLDDRRHALATDLSGGERKKCEIARVLAMKPSYFLLDEPFAAIDPLQIEDIKKLLLGLKARGVGLLITDHRVHDILSCVERAYVVTAGRVLTHGSPDEIVRDAMVRRIYLGDGFRPV